MLFQALESWEAVIDVIQMFLILVILILFFRNRLHEKQKVFKAAKTDDTMSFNSEVFSRAMQQQLEQAFVNIIAGVRVEISNLERVLQIGQLQAEKPLEDDLQPLSHLDSTGWQDRQKHIEKLSGKGMSIQHISEELKIPKAEIELILSLKEAGT